MSVIKEIEKVQKNSIFPNSNFVVDEGEGAKYWRYRVLRPIVKGMYKTFRYVNKPSPWLTPASIIFFKKYFTKEMIGAEFGSGFSTLFIAPRVRKLVSVEHNKEWHQIVVDKLEKDNVENIDYHFVNQEKESDAYSSPQFYSDFGISEKNYEYRKDYVNYFSILNSYPDEHFDFIIVDGRARPECVFSSYSKLKVGGLMILDNSERDRYRIVFDELNDLETYTTTNGLTDTTFWLKK